jgi:hypothetical protein
MVATAGLISLLPTSSFAAYPGANGQVAFVNSGMYLRRTDGTRIHRFTKSSRDDSISSWAVQR